MPIASGKYSMQGQMLTFPRVEADGTVEFFGPPPQTKRSKPLAPLCGTQTKRKVDLADLTPDGPQLPERRVRQRLAGTSVGVMDVGQGNCNMLIDGEHPTVYFDTGYPLRFYSRSAPGPVYRPVPGTPSGPIAQNAAGNLEVILSHWDWDHWRLAVKWPELQQLHWIVPKQVIGASARNFYEGLPNRHRLPRSREPRMLNIHTPNYRLCTCHPGPHARADKIQNNTGLGMAVQATLPSPGQPGQRAVVLLTADANFSSLPVELTGLPNIAGITAVHHGSDANGAAEALPEPQEGIGGGRIAYSYGCGPPPERKHPYGFPKETAKTKYEEANWGEEPGTANSTAQGPNINQNGIVPPKRGNVRMGDPTALNQQQYGNTAFATFPPENRLS